MICFCQTAKFRLTFKTQSTNDEIEKNVELEKLEDEIDIHTKGSMELN